MIAVDVAAVPFISHAATCPVVALRQTRSVFPSPFRSAVAMTDQLLSAYTMPPVRAPVGPISQTDVLPVASWNTTSVMPSPLKSPVATSVALGSNGSRVVTKGAVPFMSHIAVWPVLSLRHRRSVLPSPLKSPVATTDHVGSE